jgi:Domain of unknown function (DUF4250)
MGQTCPAAAWRAIDFMHLLTATGGIIFSFMDLSRYLVMDPHLLVGLLNTELRNHCDSLEDLVKTHDLEPEALTTRMAAADYFYQPAQNQFR